MAFVKVVKNKAYFMRYQTKFKRRREGKTDYYARQRLIIQDKDKYNTHKYRLVGRITSTRVIAQIIYATIKGDYVFAAADSQEFRKFGLTAGLSNYASAYATGLLLARRVLKKIGLADKFKGAENIDGKPEEVQSKEEFETKPFECILDVGLKATTKGSKIFAILKGAWDGGLYIPHSTTNYPTGEDEEKNPGKLHRERIFGAHVDKWIGQLKSNKNKYDLQFSKWQKCLTDSQSGSVEKLFAKIHSEIRKNADFKKKEAKQNPKRDHTKKISKKLTNEQRKKNVQTKIQIRMKEAQKAAKKKA